MPRHSALLGQNGDLGQRLGEHTQQDVVTDLDHARQLAVADIGDAAAEQSEKGLGNPVLLLGPEATIESRPALTTLALPETGAASIAMPRIAACLRTAAEASVETLEQSIRSFGA